MNSVLTCLVVLQSALAIGQLPPPAIDSLGAPQSFPIAADKPSLSLPKATDAPSVKASGKPAWSSSAKPTAESFTPSVKAAAKPTSSSLKADDDGSIPKASDESASSSSNGSEEPSLVKASEETTEKSPTSATATVDPIGSILVDGVSTESVPTFSTTNCLPCAPQGVILFGSVQYLLWKADRPGLDFAIIDPTDDLSPQGSIQSANWNTRSGIRSTIGFINSDHSWFSTVGYTYFHTAGNSQLTSPTGGTLYGLLTAPSAFGGEFTSASAGANLNYQVADANIGRLIKLGPRTDARIFGGVRGAWIDQAFNAYYTNGLGTTLVSSPLSFRGIGLDTGGRADWWITDYMGVFGRADVAMMVGDIHSSLNQTSDGGQSYSVGIASSDHRVIPVVGLATGAQMNWRSLKFTVGYEVTQWFNLIQSYDVVGFVGNPAKLAQRTGDLSLSGLFLQLGLDY